MHQRALPLWTPCHQYYQQLVLLPSNPCLPCFLPTYGPFSAPLHCSALKEPPFIDRPPSFPEPSSHYSTACLKVTNDL